VNDSAGSRVGKLPSGIAGVDRILPGGIPELFGPLQLSEYGISFTADNVILLRYVELFGRMGCALHVMKVRGSQHSKDIREFTIATEGIPYWHADVGCDGCPCRVAGGEKRGQTA